MCILYYKLIKIGELILQYYIDYELWKKDRENKEVFDSQE